MNRELEVKAMSETVNMFDDIDANTGQILPR